MEFVMNPILVLFDIDGTLVGGSKAGEDAYVNAIQHCYGCRINLSGYSSSGKTDLLVMRELLERHNFKIDAIDMECLTNAYLEALPEMIVRDPGTVLPGVKALLDILSQRDDFILGLATGNLEKGAAMKLGFHELYQYFSVGGFGSDAIDRAAIIAAGIRKAKELFVSDFSKIVVVGDTPRDIQAARSNEVAILAVATGIFSEDALKSAEPNLVLPNLRETDRIVDILTTQSMPGFQTRH
jgi:phosphoglycolate phosphatase